jgi:hypothetical protein
MFQVFLNPTTIRLLSTRKRSHAFSNPLPVSGRLPTSLPTSATPGGPTSPPISVPISLPTSPPTSLSTSPPTNGPTNPPTGPPTAPPTSPPTTYESPDVASDQSPAIGTDQSFYESPDVAANQSTDTGTDHSPDVAPDQSQSSYKPPDIAPTSPPISVPRRRHRPPTAVPTSLPKLPPKGTATAPPGKIVLASLTPITKPTCAAMFLTTTAKTSSWLRGSLTKGLDVRCT